MLERLHRGRCWRTIAWTPCRSRTLSTVHSRLEKLKETRWCSFRLRLRGVRNGLRLAPKAQLAQKPKQVRVPCFPGEPSDFVGRNERQGYLCRHASAVDVFVALG